jgi:hypothetical protein
VKEKVADYGRGIKAGIIGSMVYSLVWSIFFFFTGATLLGQPAALWDPFAVTYAASTIVSGIIGGIIVGAIFAALYDGLPTKNSIVKGINGGLIFWLIFSLILGFATYGFAVLYLGATLIFQVLLFGTLLGVSWDMFGGKKN